MLRQGLILTSQREYAQVMRHGLLSLGDERTRVDVELDALRAMQLVPQQYDLILLDTMLDAMDGLQLLLLLKQQAPSSKFIIVSDSADETSRAQAYQNGADFFLERPRSPEVLKTVLSNIARLLKPRSGDEAEGDDEYSPPMRVVDSVLTRCLSGDSALLLVRGQQQNGDIFIYRGEIYHAQYPGRSGEEALRDMAGWDNGLVRIKAMKLNHVPPRTIETPYRQLLDKLEHAATEPPDMRPSPGEFMAVAAGAPPVPSVVLEAPPLAAGAEEAPEPVRPSDAAAPGETPLPAVNAHWKVNLMGELVEGSQVAEPGRCAFITYFIYRKLADVAVALEVDYFTHAMLFGPHLQQVLVADNLGVRHAVFDTAWTSEAKREQYVKWCCEQSF